MHLELLRQTPVVSVYYDTSNDWLFADWHGELTLPLVQASCQALIQCFWQRPCTRVLNNNTDVAHVSPDVPQWLAEDYLRYLSQSGVECQVAWVCPSSTSRQLLTSTVTHYFPTAGVTLFDELSEAYAWLQHSRFHHPDAQHPRSIPTQQAALAEQLRNCRLLARTTTSYPRFN